MKRLGIVRHQLAHPLLYGLRASNGHPSFEIAESPHAGSAELAVRLRNGELDAALLSPIDYARDYSRYKIVPSVGVSSAHESGAICLLFREGLHRISTVAADPSAASEVVLTHLIFAEKYDDTPTIVPTTAGPAEALSAADAVLLVGDAALSASDAKKLDLVDEWYDITGLPFVHGFWVSFPEALTAAEISSIIGSGKNGASNLERVSPNHAYLRKFRYDLGDDERAAVTEFYRMAYYHGILRDIPDLNLHSDPLGAPISTLPSN